ncbi:MAG: 2-oxoacid:acceptor oxidoreductase family protein [Chloroflexota bacterium]|nr:2-oxoacid:acceptor oxidoreductase family protein [Chloroflexota bacterium]MDE3194249.1 2-oxoacid:acceptor oxidoreductase family protein [Chloroflexota bacterium]
MTELRVRVAGSGGQGIAVAALLFADAAVRAGLHATHSQAYGPESRGGASKADVIVSRAPIAFPIAARIDVLVALTRAALERYRRDLETGGLLLVDRDAAATPDGAARVLPLVAEARRVLGAALGANLVALGALVAATNAVPLAAVEEAIRAHPPGGDPERALRALRAGLALTPVVVAEEEVRAG